MNATNNATRTVTVTSRFGTKSVQTTLTTQQAAQVVTSQPTPNAFALDLVAKNAKYGLSPKQDDWLVFLAQEYLDKQSKPAQVAPQVLASTQALFQLFATAHLQLKYPRLRLQTTDGRLVVVKLSGPASKHCGSLNLTNGAKFGDSSAVFYGYVHQDGTATVTDQGVLDLLQALAADPAGVAASYGFASGNCCFCGKTLSDSEAGSSEVGYGQTCSTHWHLPWHANGQAKAPVSPVAKPKRTRKPRGGKALDLLAQEELATLAS